MKTELSIGRFGMMPIAIHWTFLLLIPWIILVNFLADFQIQGLVWSLLLVLSLFVSVLAHELGHALVAKYFGQQASGIILLPIGGVVNLPAITKKRGQELLILLAGPVINLAIASVLTLFINPFQAYWNAPETIGAASSGNFLFQLQIINLSLFIFNLIPAFPMDGGAILTTLLTIRLNVTRATRIVFMCSKVIAFGFILSGIIGIHLLFLLLGAFIFFTAGTEEYYPRLKTMAKAHSLNDKLIID